MSSSRIPCAAEKKWVEQWKRAGPALAEQKKRELSALTPEEALAASEALLSLAPLSKIPPSRLETSGLVEQQAIFRRLQPTAGK